MISLVKMYKNIIQEGGNVFKNTEYDTVPIPLSNISTTVDKFIDDLSRTFPNKRSSFQELSNKKNWLGSTGNKPESGDVDLAYSSKNFFIDGEADTQGWGIDKDAYDALYEKKKKSSRTATNEQIVLKALIQLVVQKINSTGGDSHASDKASGAEAIHLSFPQYSQDGKKLDSRTQLDLDIGNIEWLIFRKNSELPKDNPNIKGLHRGQLMLAMFATTGYTFKSGMGFIRKSDREILADSPEGAVEVFNSEYMPNTPLTVGTLNNYNKLMDFVKNSLKPEDKEKTLNFFSEALRRANAYVPDNI